MQHKKLSIFFWVIVFFLLFFLWKNNFVNAQAIQPKITIGNGLPSSDGLDCEFNVNVDFGTVEQVIGNRTIEPNPPFDRLPPPTLISWTRAYDIAYSYLISVWSPQTLSITIPAWLVCNKWDDIKKNCISENALGTASKEVACTTWGTIPPTTWSTTPSTATWWKDKPICTDTWEWWPACICISTNDNCCGVGLLTNVPFIGKCIELRTAEEIAYMKEHKQLNSDPNTLTITEEEAFPRLILGLTKILVTVILLASFGAIIVAWVMMASAGTDDGQVGKGKALIWSVIVGLALLGASGVILRIINPNFFG